MMKKWLTLQGRFRQADYESVTKKTTKQRCLCQNRLFRPKHLNNFLRPIRQNKDIKKSKDFRTNECIPMSSGFAVGKGYGVPRYGQRARIYGVLIA